MGWQNLIFSVVLGFAVSNVASAFDPQTVSMPIDKAFVPVGFDDNDRSELTVMGNFPGTCYKVASYQVEVDENTQVITLRQNAYVYGGICLQLLVPYTQTMDLGILKEGNYAVKDHASGKTLGTVPVLRAKSLTPDDYLYAPVTDAYVSDQGEGKHSLTFRGNFTDRCTRLKDVQIHYYDEVIVVQPIAEHIGTPPNCGHELVRFQHSVPLKEGLKGVRLLHVRVMDGQAINRFVDF